MKYVLAICAVACGFCGTIFAQAPTTQPLATSNSFTFHQLENATPREAYEKLAAEAHLTLDPFSVQALRAKESVRITASFDHATFWEAFAELADKTSSAPLAWNNGNMFINMTFDPSTDQDPQSLSWDVPTTLASVLVPFHFKDVPLPVLAP
jgi:hypothetical protein